MIPTSFFLSTHTIYHRRDTHYKPSLLQSVGSSSSTGTYHPSDLPRGPRHLLQDDTSHIYVRTVTAIFTHFTPLHFPSRAPRLSLPFRFDTAGLELANTVHTYFCTLHRHLHHQQRQYSGLQARPTSLFLLFHLLSALGLGHHQRQHSISRVTNTTSSERLPIFRDTAQAGANLLPSHPTEIPFQPAGSDRRYLAFFLPSIPRIAKQQVAPVPLCDLTHLTWLGFRP